MNQRFLRAFGALSLVLVSTATMGFAVVAAPTTAVVGTCTDAAAVPCSVSPGQLYGSLVVARSGNDAELTVEAVLSHVFGQEADVSRVDDFRYSSDAASHGRAFDWSYDGTLSNVAYLTVKAADAFAVIGVAGLRTGDADVADLLGGHEISHVTAWSTKFSYTAPIAASKLYGDGFVGNSRLAKIEGGTVPCVHEETGETIRCAFTRRSGAWLESREGRFAKAGQSIGPDGAEGGEYVVAATIGLDGAVPCLAPSGHDFAGIPAGMELHGACVVEQPSSPYNATGRPLRNFATREVCTRSYPHPDGVNPHRSYALSTTSGIVTIYCYTGAGAALNDVNGTERDPYGYYYPQPEYCHVIWWGGYEVPAAKRPSTKSFPAPGVSVPNSTLVWRPVAESVPLAN